MAVWKQSLLILGTIQAQILLSISAGADHEHLSADAPSVEPVNLYLSETIERVNPDTFKFNHRITECSGLEGTVEDEPLKDCRREQSSIFSMRPWNLSIRPQSLSIRPQGHLEDKRWYKQGNECKENQSTILKRNLPPPRRPRAQRVNK